MLKLRVDFPRYVNVGIVINKEVNPCMHFVWALGKEPRHNKLLWLTLIQYSRYTQVVCVSQQLYTIESTLYSTRLQYKI